MLQRWFVYKTAGTPNAIDSSNMPGVKHHLLLLNAVLLVAGAAAVSLSDYVTPCKNKDPELNECIRQAAEDLLRKAGKGLPEVGIPPLDPAKVPKLEVARQGALTMNLVFSNSTHYGLAESKVKSARVDTERHSYNFTVLIPKYIVSGNYDINGRVILLPVAGHGQANITFTEIETDWSFSGAPEKRNGKTYLKLTNLVTHIHSDSPKNVKIHFDGLFGGNKALGDTMNEFMNSNWQELTKQLKPSVQTSFDRRLLPVAQHFVSHFPLDELFSDI